MEVQTRAFVVFWVLALGGLLVTACAGVPGRRERGEAPYAFVYLKTGPNSASHTPEQKQEIFRGHMSNMQRLAKEKTLIIAGPFVQPRDKAWRGLFVFDVGSVEQAQRIAATDPGVVSGEFVTDIRAAWGSPSLRDALRLEDQMQAKLKAEGGPQRQPGEPPPGLRGYVIVHADDVDKAVTALRAASTGAPGILWSLQFQGTCAGVMVLNATRVEDVQAALAPLDTGPVQCDGWFSTQALEGLAPSR